MWASRNRTKMSKIDRGHLAICFVKCLIYCGLCDIIYTRRVLAFCKGVEFGEKTTR